MSEEPQAGGARRVKSETRQKGEQLSQRYTEAEAAALTRAAEAAGLSVAGYIRGRALAGTATPTTQARRRPTADRALLAQAVALLGRAAGSIQQIAKRLNFGQVEYAGELPAALAEVRSAIAALLQAAGGRP